MTVYGGGGYGGGIPAPRPAPPPPAPAAPPAQGGTGGPPILPPGGVPAQSAPTHTDAGMGYTPQLASANHMAALTQALAASRAGASVFGKISWFGGPHDPMAGPTTASGLPTTHPGIAVFNTHTLGGYWLVKTPNGVSRVIQQTDIGPAPQTGRSVDFTNSALPLFGYTEHSFPTDSTIRAVYLGKGQGAARGPFLP